MTAATLRAAASSSARGMAEAGTRYPVRDIRRLRTYVKREDPDTGEVRISNFRSWTRGKPFGLLIHSTGPGMDKYARTYGIDHVETVNRVYGNPSNSCAHMVVLTDGTRIRTVSSYSMAPHCGVTASERVKLMNGTWRAWTSDEAEAHWDKRWPGIKSPQHLFPGASGNAAYEGLETWKRTTLDPDTGTFYTDAQYRSTAQWIVEREREWGFIAEGRRLVTHDDVQPFSRWDAHGGRDPGAFRSGQPFYDWTRLLNYIAQARKCTAWTAAVPA